MLSFLAGLLWAGSSLGISLIVMTPYLRDSDLPRFPLFCLTVAIYLLCLLFTHVLGRLIGFAVRRVLPKANASGPVRQ